jgi:hypothetical protein
VRPSLYALAEDVVAVDGGQGTQFREVWNERYLTSPHIQKLLLNLSWYWGISGLVVAVALTVVIFTVENVDISFALGICEFSLRIAMARRMLTIYSHRLVHPMGLGWYQCSHHY